MTGVIGLDTRLFQMASPMSPMGKHSHLIHPKPVSFMLLLKQPSTWLVFLSLTVLPTKASISLGRNTMKKQNSENLAALVKLLKDPRMPTYGGHEYKGAGTGMGRLLLGLTAHGRKINGKVVRSEEHTSELQSQSN